MEVLIPDLLYTADDNNDGSFFQHRTFINRIKCVYFLNLALIEPFFIYQTC